MMQSSFEEKIGQQSTEHERGFLAWWYRLTAPPKPPATASLQQREVVRRARFGGFVLMLLFIFNVPSLPPAFIGTNRGLLGILCFLFVATVIAALVNRTGAVYLAGVITVVAYTSGIMANILTTPGGLNLMVIPLFTLFVIPELLAAAMLPPVCVFVSAVINVLFCFLAITFMHHDSNLNSSMPVIYSNGFFLVATVQAVIAGIAYLWGQSLERAIRARDQAEEIARLESDLSEQSLAMAQQKEQLEKSIELVIQTQSRVANGDLQARVPLTSENVLWSVAGTLNNLISRLQRSRMAEHELEQTRASVTRLMTIVRNRRLGQPAPPYARSGTLIDPLALELLSPIDVPSMQDDQVHHE